MSKIHGEEENKESELRTFESGATRSKDVDEWRFDLAPACATRREAKIWAEGAEKHGENNWKSGIPIPVCLNHLEYHLNKYKEGDRSEDHLAKIAVNAAMVMYFEDHVTSEGLRRALVGGMGDAAQQTGRSPR